MAKYRKEILDVSSFPLDDCRELVAAFNSTFPKKDAYMALEESAIHIMLIQLDMVKYREFLDGLSISEDLIKEAFDVINSIGSYGLKGSKRLFSGYNAERKVVNRKAKEQSRSKHYYANDHS